MPRPGSRIRVLVADDQRLVRDGIASLLSLDEELQVVGVAQNGAEAVSLARELRPEVCLLDIRMPGMDGLAALERIKAEDSAVCVLMLTTFDDREYIARSLRLGATGYLLKDLPSEQLVRAVKQAAGGLFLADGGVMSRFMSSLDEVSPGPAEQSGDEAALQHCGSLSERERKVLGLLGLGLTNAEIADNLYLSEGTVKNYVSSILTSLGFRDRVQAALFAARNRLE